MTEIYSNKQPLQCCDFPNLHRAIGVEVNQYGSHLSVDFERMSVGVNTASFGKNTPIEEVESQVIESTEWVVSHLEKVIAELQDHRARLVNELTSIRANGLKLHNVEAVEHGVQRIGGTCLHKSIDPDACVCLDCGENRPVPAKASGALCPECDCQVLDTGYCMMGHWNGTPRSGG